MGRRVTRQVPGLAFVEVDFGNGMDSEAAVDNLLGKVVGDELLVRGVEAEAGRQPWLPTRTMMIVLGSYTWQTHRGRHMTRSMSSLILPPLCVKPELCCERGAGSLWDECVGQQSLIRMQGAEAVTNMEEVAVRRSATEARIRS